LYKSSGGSQGDQRRDFTFETAVLLKEQDERGNAGNDTFYVLALPPLARQNRVIFSAFCFIAVRRGQTQKRD
jgi:hypothetical protein